MGDRETLQEQQVDTKGCGKGCLILVAILGAIILLFSACMDNMGSSGRSYQPGDFDFDGDSGDLDDANEFLKWKINEENK